MSPLMDVNLQLGLLSLIVLDMKQKGTYTSPVRDFYLNQKFKSIIFSVASFINMCINIITCLIFF